MSFTITDGSAQKAFDGDRSLMSEMGVHGFPTFLVKYNDFQYMLRGYNSYDTFVAVIKSATQGTVNPISVEVTEEQLLTFMENHPRMAAEEIRQAFDFASIEEVKSFIAPIIKRGRLEIQEAGNGWFARLTGQGMTCDLTTGICS